ncbi:NXPE family member 2-like [Aplysia californica]|uniref:NXPE family member 2-like n=1 Tax=Aplysia californica TaxID=6500 RepID=A0ABM0JMD0_APLCA|nr:NXPE family member 2-like [Aplysia californica]
MKRMFNIMQTDFCTTTAAEDRPFPSPANCSNPELNITIYFAAHAHPFNLPHPDHFRVFNKPLSHWLDGIRAEADVVVILHLYLHFSQFNLEVFNLHAQDAQRGVARLLRRNPRARVVLRGPHVTYKGWPSHVAGGDLLAEHFHQILRREFTDVRHRVCYLNAWDMTVAVANLNFHPEEFVHRAMLQVVFAHFIGRG